MPVDANADELFDEIYCSTKIEYRVLLEMKLISTEFISGSVYVIPSKSNSLLWHGLIFLRTGVFKNAVLRFTIQLDASFPSQKSAPILKILSLPFEHPLISADGVFDSSHAFPQWNENEHLYTLLKYFKFCLENIQFCCNLPDERIVNKNVVESFTKDPKMFQTRAQQAVARSVNEIFSNESGGAESCFIFDRSAIEEDAEIHHSILENMKSIADTLPECFSFMLDARRAPN